MGLAMYPSHPAARMIFVPLHRQGGEGDDGYGAQRGIAFEEPCGLESVYSRKLHVHEDEVGQLGHNSNGVVVT